MLPQGQRGHSTNSFIYCQNRDYGPVSRTMRVSAECLPYTHLLHDHGLLRACRHSFHSNRGNRADGSCSAGNTFCTKIRLRRATDRVNARTVIDNQIESLSANRKKKKFALLRARRCSELDLIQPRHSTQPCARPELARWHISASCT
jgi:hypothetical protein